MSQNLFTDDDVELTVISAYHPDSTDVDEEQEKFYDEYNKFLQDVITPDSNVIIGCDANIQLGIAENKKEMRYMGHFANNWRSKAGVGEHRLSKLLLPLDLTTANTDFKHKQYDTWTLFFTLEDVNTQIDYFFIRNTKRMKKAVLDAKTIYKVGIDSDHNCIQIQVNIPSILADIEKRDMDNELGEPPNTNELE